MTPKTSITLDPHKWVEFSRARYHRRNPDAKRNLIIDVVVTSILIVAMLFGFKVLQESHQTLLKSSGAKAISADELVSQIKDQNLVAYWLGPISGSKYSLVTTEKGQVVITYLSNGEGISESQIRKLVVVTRVDSEIDRALVNSENIFTNSNEKTNVGNVFSYDTSIMNYMRVDIKNQKQKVLVYYPTPRKATNMQLDAESLIRIN